MGLFSFINNRSKRKHTEFNHKKFIIPVDCLTTEEAEEQMKKLMKNYQEDVFWDDNLGEVRINEEIKIPFQKDYWIPANSNKK